MNTQNISLSEKLGGFPIEDATASLLKKLLWRANTGNDSILTSESNQLPYIWQDQINSDSLPDVLPTDFVVLTDNQIANNFQINISEIQGFKTTVNGSNVFSVSQSVLYPYIYKFTNCRLQPFCGNVDESFSGTTPITNKNILSLSIPFTIKNGLYTGSLCRTQSNGELSLGGNDILTPTQLPYIFDNGWLNLYASDNVTISVNKITRNNPPAVTCYIYTGGFGNIGNGGISNISTISAGNGISITGESNAPIITNTLPTQWSNLTSNQGIYFNQGKVLVGKNSTINNYSVEISGTLYSDNIIAQSLETFSDKRLKINISTISTNERVLNLGTFSFNYITNPNVTEIGFIAQEVEAIVPEIVREKSGYKTIQYDRIPVLLLPLIKQQQQQIEILTEELRLIKAAVGVR
jgi:hypothetical protein